MLRISLTRMVQAFYTVLVEVRQRGRIKVVLTHFIASSGSLGAGELALLYHTAIIRFVSGSLRLVRSLIH